MDLEDRLTRLKGEILAIKRDVVEKGAESAFKTIPSDIHSATICYKLDTLISDYLRLKEKIQTYKEQGRF